METARFDAWMALYRTAWESDDPADIAAAFEPDARYFTSPGRPADAGIDAIVSMWVGRRNSQIRWSFEHSVVAVEGDLYVVRGVTTYPDGLDGAGEDIFDNLWLVSLADSGRAVEFVEYWMLREAD